MANARILYNMDTWDGATIPGSSQANADLVPANVVHDHVSKMWRTTGKASENIVFDLGSATKITVFSIIRFRSISLRANRKHRLIRRLLTGLRKIPGLDLIEK